MKAIVVDDSRTTRIILNRALVREGFQSVAEAGDGKQALDQLLKSGPVDLALVDWNMPVMTGFELVMEIRARPELNGMSIMMVTTETESAQIQRALDAGANEYVTKPFTDAVLKEKLLLLGLVQG